MTVIINSIWGGRITQIVDRQISQQLPNGSTRIVDNESNKVCIVATINALVSIAYTGVAVVHQQWFDHLLANTLTHETLPFALVQPGSPFLARPIHIVINELLLNLNGKLNTDPRARLLDLKLSIVGFHVNPRNSKCTPLSWLIYRDYKIENGFRYFQIEHQKVRKQFRKYPRGLCVEYYGDYGETIKNGIHNLGETEGLTHDNVEIYIRDLIRKRSTETKTVSSDCIAIQLDLGISKGHIQVTHYSKNESIPFISPWVVMPRMICSPSITDSSCGASSSCGKYLTSGFSDGFSNLHVKTRIQKIKQQKFNNVLSSKFQERPPTI